VQAALLLGPCHVICLTTDKLKAASGSHSTHSNFWQYNIRALGIVIVSIFNLDLVTKFGLMDKSSHGFQ